jgi:hypothetical protein
MITYAIKWVAFLTAVAALCVLVLLAGTALLVWDGFNARGTTRRV